MKVVSPSPHGEVVVSLTGTTTIGRAEGNNLVVRDPKASREHAVIHVQRDGSFMLIDLGSANGTYLNGVRVVLPARVRAGDVVQVGSTMLRVVEGADKSPDEVLGGEDTATVISLDKREITVLVADVRGYTTISERLPVEQLSQLMGHWFRIVSALVHEHRGLIDKFMGDGVMALWVATPDDPGASVEQAVTAAIALCRESMTVTEGLPWWPADALFRIGIGLNTGMAIMGTLGTAARRDFTATGDTVNIAFRIEPLTKTFPYPILASEATVRHVLDRFRFVSIGPVEVKGKSQSIMIYGLDPSGAHEPTTTDISSSRDQKFPGGSR